MNIWGHDSVIPGCSNCCVDKDTTTQVLFQPVDQLPQATTYSHHDLDTDIMMDPTDVESPRYPEACEVNDSAFLPRLEECASEKSRSPGEVQKAQVLGVMKAFATKAFDGIDCWTIGAEGGEMLPIQYVLTQDLQNLIFKSPGKPDLTCNISALTSFCRGCDAWGCLPKLVAQTFDDSMLKRLVAFQCGKKAIFVLEATEEEAEHLVTAMWVLRSYNNQKAKGALNELDSDDLVKTQ